MLTVLSDTPQSWKGPPGKFSGGLFFGDGGWSVGYFGSRVLQFDFVLSSWMEVAEMSDVKSIRKALREERTMLAAARRCSDAELAAESLKLIEGFELMLAEALVKARKGMVKGGVSKADESPGKPAVVPSRDGRSR